jgi:hypothetical protein
VNQGFFYVKSKDLSQKQPQVSSISCLGYAQNLRWFYSKPKVVLKFAATAFFLKSI